MMAKDVNIRLTPYQAKVIWAVVDGAADAGVGTNSDRETRALNAVASKLLDQHDKWKAA